MSPLSPFAWGSSEIFSAFVRPVLIPMHSFQTCLTRSAILKTERQFLTIQAREGKELVDQLAHLLGVFLNDVEFAYFFIVQSAFYSP